jgi:muramoyltetrapeptide carboxypeptidase LdcA involved in peptidoglycan recycling
MGPPEGTGRLRSCGTMRPMIAATRFGVPLPEGGCVGVPAPASPWENRSDLLRGVEWWQARGYRVKLADGIEARDSYAAGDAKGRARDLGVTATVDAARTIDQPALR